MPYCPECRYEYVPGIKQCPDCYVDLVEALPEEKKSEDKSEYIDSDLVCVATYPYEIMAQEAYLNLQSHGIESAIMNEIMSQIDIVVASADGGVRLMVREADAEAAIAVLESR